MDDITPAEIESATMSTDRERIARFRERFDKIRDGMAQLRSTTEARERKTAQHFNLFRLLGVAHDEVRTHSALLAELLNPRGAHAQGKLFLTRFLSFCTSKYPEFPQLPPDSGRRTWQISTERITALGNLDIMVACPSVGFRFVIENKIYAGEQPSQLRRYADWLGSGVAHYPLQALIFLTPDGRRADSADTVAYYPLSYREDVRKWLRESLPNVSAPRVRYTLVQYLDVLDQL